MSQTYLPKVVSTLLEILDDEAAEIIASRTPPEHKFQPFLRFWTQLVRSPKEVEDLRFQPFLRFWEAWEGHGSAGPAFRRVSTLLEIQRLMCLVVVGF